MNDVEKLPLLLPLGFMSRKVLAVQESACRHVESLELYKNKYDHDVS